MFQRTVEIGDEHADWWEGFTIEKRHIDGPVDIATGTHETYGATIVSHYGLGSLAQWWTARPIPTTAFWAANDAPGSL